MDARLREDAVLLGGAFQLQRSRDGGARVSNGVWGDAQFIGVRRALGDFQAGEPVIVDDGQEARLAMSVETLTPERLACLRQCDGQLFLAISATKARLGHAAGAAATLALVTADDCRTILDRASGLNTAPITSAVPGDGVDEAIIALAKLCHLLPAAVTVRLTGANAAAFPSSLRVAPAEVLHFPAARAASLRLVSRARVALRGDADSEFVVFRDAMGDSWTAVIIGSPDLARPVSVRLHSSCLTGDSFGSLRCDCGDQLRMSIDILRASGGVLLYLDQEGCGIGLANKMRAYALQDGGLDTIDANRALGFESDERRYDMAARMLYLLGIGQVYLLTNNPAKVTGLADAGIGIMGRIPLIAPVNQENRRYLDTKARRAGHLLNEPHGCTAHGSTRT